MLVLPAVEGDEARLRGVDLEAGAWPIGVRNLPRVLRAAAPVAVAIEAIAGRITLVGGGPEGSVRGLNRKARAIKTGEQPVNATPYEANIHQRGCDSND